MSVYLAVEWHTLLFVGLSPKKYILSLRGHSTASICGGCRGSCGVSHDARRMLPLPQAAKASRINLGS